MKTIVSVQEILEYDIKPPAAVAQWRALVDAEIIRQWTDRSRWVRVDWPTCMRKNEIPAFERSGVAYMESPRCGSLFAPHRPSEDELWAWYRESEPARFWREHLLPASDEARREKITRPRADWVLDGIAEYMPKARRLVDISTYGRGLLDMVVSDSQLSLDVVAAGMTSDLEGVSTANVQVKPTRVEDLQKHGSADVVVAVDALDRAADMGALVKALEKLIVPGGVIFATAAVASGFEIQTLWERSPTIMPPDKLNLPSVEGLQQIFASPTWEILELSTPGMFDVEMVRRAITSEPNVPWSRIVRSLVEHTDADGRMALVELLQSRRLASFARLVARRRS